MFVSLWTVMVKRFELLKTPIRLADFYSRIFMVETGEGPLVDFNYETECGEITITLQMVLDNLTKLNPSKSPGPDPLHPRIIYETRQIIIIIIIIIIFISQLNIK